MDDHVARVQRDGEIVGLHDRLAFRRGGEDERFHGERFGGVGWFCFEGHGQLAGLVEVYASEFGCDAIDCPG